MPISFAEKILSTNNNYKSLKLTRKLRWEPVNSNLDTLTKEFMKNYSNEVNFPASPGDDLFISELSNDNYLINYKANLLGFGPTSTVNNKKVQKIYIEHASSGNYEVFDYPIAIDSNINTIKVICGNDTVDACESYSKRILKNVSKTVMASKKDKKKSEETEKPIIFQYSGDKEYTIPNYPNAIINPEEKFNLIHKNDEFFIILNKKKIKLSDVESRTLISRSKKIFDVREEHYSSQELQDNPRKVIAGFLYDPIKEAINTIINSLIPTNKNFGRTPTVQNIRKVNGNEGTVYYDVIFFPKHLLTENNLIQQTFTVVALEIALRLHPLICKNIEKVESIYEGPYPGIRLTLKNTDVQETLTEDSLLTPLHEGLISTKPIIIDEEDMPEIFSNGVDDGGIGYENYDVIDNTLNVIPQLNDSGTELSGILLRTNDPHPIHHGFLLRRRLGNGKNIFLDANGNRMYTSGLDYSPTDFHLRTDADRARAFMEHLDYSPLKDGNLESPKFKHNLHHYVVNINNSNIMA